jgi:hypothetical protein
MSAILKSGLVTGHVKPKIGSCILNSKAELLSGELGSRIREELELRGVLVFPKINFADPEQIVFTKTLRTFAPERGDGENITKTTLDVKKIRPAPSI